MIWRRFQNILTILAIFLIWLLIFTLTARSQTSEEQSVWIAELNQAAAHYLKVFERSTAQWEEMAVLYNQFANAHNEQQKILDVRRDPRVIYAEKEKLRHEVVRKSEEWQDSQEDLLDAAKRLKRAMEHLPH